MSTTANEANLLEQLQRDPFNEKGGSMQSSEDDAKLHVEFFMQPVYQQFISENTDPPRKIYEDSEFIKIFIPGDKQTNIIRQTFPNDKLRWPQQYARFKQGLTDQVIGTPLSSMPTINEAKIKEYEFFNIRTIEQLAECADGSQCGQAMRGFHDDKRKAVQFVEAAKGSAPVKELREELDQLRAELAAMRGAKSGKAKAEPEVKAE